MSPAAPRSNRPERCRPERALAVPPLDVVLDTPARAYLYFHARTGRCRARGYRGG